MSTGSSLLPRMHRRRRVQWRRWVAYRAEVLVWSSLTAPLSRVALVTLQGWAGAGRNSPMYVITVPVRGLRGAGVGDHLGYRWCHVTGLGDGL